MTPKVRTECGLGRVLLEEGQEKYDDIVAAIFATIHVEDSEGVLHDTGVLYPPVRLIELFEEYGWSESLFRRHRKGECIACLKR